MLGMFDDKDKLATMVVNSLDPERVKQVDKGQEISVNPGIEFAGQSAFEAFQAGDHQQFTRSLVNLFSILSREKDSQHEMDGSTPPDLMA